MTARFAQTDPPNARRATPLWFGATAALGTLWNAYGVFQFSHAVAATRESLVAMGMTETQAEAMSSYPLWMTFGFAIGTFGGLLGTLLLLLRRRSAVTVLAGSLIGYAILYVGDITEGVFAAIGTSQIVILTLVVTIAAALLWVARRARRDGLLA